MHEPQPLSAMAGRGHEALLEDLTFDRSRLPHHESIYPDSETLRVAASGPSSRRCLSDHCPSPVCHLSATASASSYSDMQERETCIW